MAVTRGARSEQGWQAADSGPPGGLATAADAPAPEEKSPRQSRRRPRPPKDQEPASAAEAAAVAAVEAVETVPVATSVVRLDPGLYAVEIVADDAPSETERSGSSLVWLAQVPSGSASPPDVLSAAASGDQWLGGTDKIVAIRAPGGGAVLTATIFGSSDHPPSPPEVIVRVLESGLEAIETRPAPPPAVPEPPPVPQPAMPVPVAAPAQRGERELPIEVTVHIERFGDRTFAGGAWAGRPGDQKRVEGFSIKALHELQVSEVEYKALHPGGIETPWVPGPQFCGTRGQSLPITGIAIRIAPHVQDQFSVVYQAAFFRSGVTELRSNGAPCLPRLPGDALEGVNIRITQRGDHS